MARLRSAQGKTSTMTPYCNDGNDISNATAWLSDSSNDSQKSYADLSIWPLEGSSNLISDQIISDALTHFAFFTPSSLRAHHTSICVSSTSSPASLKSSGAEKKPRYAILSHIWGPEEVIFSEVSALRHDRVVKWCMHPKLCISQASTHLKQPLFSVLSRLRLYIRRSRWLASRL